MFILGGFVAKFPSTGKKKNVSSETVKCWKPHHRLIVIVNLNGTLRVASIHSDSSLVQPAVHLGVRLEPAESTAARFK